MKEQKATLLKIAPMTKHCVHCFDPLNDESADHLFPTKWYPSTTPPDIQRPTFPSCKKCNGKYGAIENRLRTAFVLTLDPKARAAQGLVEPVHRGLDPKAGKNERDKSSRAAARASLGRRIISGDAADPHAILPGTGPDLSVPLGEQVAIQVPQEDVHEFVIKLARGLAYLEIRQLLQPPAHVEVAPLAPEDAEVLTRHLDRLGRTLNLGPGLSVRTARAPENPIGAIHEFVLFEKITVFALVHPNPQLGHSSKVTQLAKDLSE